MLEIISWQTCDGSSHWEPLYFGPPSPPSSSSPQPSQRPGLLERFRQGKTTSDNRFLENMTRRVMFNNNFPDVTVGWCQPIKEVAGQHPDYIYVHGPSNFAVFEYRRQVIGLPLLRGIFENDL